MTPPPLIDARTEEDILRELRELQRRPYRAGETGLDAALARIFARYCSIAINRLNRAPLKNQLAFMELLGIAPLPPRPARVPLTFALAPQAPDDVPVPPRIQIATRPEKGEAAPVIFETEQELRLTSLQMDSVFAAEAPADRYGDYSLALRKGPAAEAQPIFRGNQPVPHMFYLGVELPRLVPVIEELRVAVQFERPSAAPVRLSWEVWDGVEPRPLNPVADTTEGFARSGEVRFARLPQLPQARVEDITAQWIRCRLVTPLEGRPPATLPAIGSVAVRMRADRRDLPVEQALCNSVPLDLSKDFYPFGERPRFGDTLYLALDEAFSCPGEATFRIVLTNPAAGGPEPPIPRVAEPGAVLTWEYWDGRVWAALDPRSLRDGTKNLTQSGDVVFRVPGASAPLAIGGQEKYWIRVRIAAGDYARPTVPEPAQAAPAAPVPPAWSPPAIKSLRVNYSAELDLKPVAMLAYNDFVFRAIEGEAAVIVPFSPPEDEQPTCYLGFSGPEQRRARQISIYFAISTSVRGDSPRQPVTPERAVAWEYWNGRAWNQLYAEDGTAGLRYSGIVRLFLPSDAAWRERFHRRRLWVRLRLRGALDFEPRVSAVLPNTGMVSHTVTVTNEILGSSNGRPAQSFRTSHTPVVEGQLLEVLEPVQAARTDWIAWQEVSGFQASGPSDRHYLLDHESGEITFGDGARGAIPPAQTANVRMTRYQTGGGPRGNRPAGTITELMTTVPYVEAVTNHEPSTGGADAESPSGLLERVPLFLRHRDRAVAAADYEDLARAASTEVARAKCIPLADLASDPTGSRRQTGVVSLILVPRSADGNAMPPVALFDRVRSYLDARRACSAALVLVGPDYLRIDLNVEIVVSDPVRGGATEQRVEAELRQYLHPVHGRRGAGWDFGRTPEFAELAAAVEQVPGVEHVRSLDLKHEAPPVQRSPRLLIYPGAITVTAFVE